jgi:hypothetical protein
MKRPAPKPPSTRDITCKCGKVNRYRTVCVNCSENLPNLPKRGPSHEKQPEKRPEDRSVVLPRIPVHHLSQRPGTYPRRLNIGRGIVYAFVVVVAFFGFLNLVTDQPKPRITFTADSTPPACPIKHACDNL